jgi:hypothetical protein
VALLLKYPTSLPTCGLRTAYAWPMYDLYTAFLPYLWLYSRNIRLLCLRTTCVRPPYGLLALPVAPLPTYSLCTASLPSLPYLWLYSQYIRLLYLRAACVQPAYGLRTAYVWPLYSLLALPVALLSKYLTPLPMYGLHTVRGSDS